MKQYPSISKTISKYDNPTYVFDKLDGSNIRAEYTRKKGFIRFGSRHTLIDQNTPFIGKSIDLIRNKYEESLSEIFEKSRFTQVICFFEFFGSKSFAGTHEENDDFSVILFDIDVYKQGIIPPSDFVKLCSDVEIPNLLHVGNVTQEVVTSVKNGTLDGMTFEGVVCKTKVKKITQMYKIKSSAWLDALKNKCGDDMALFEKLS